MLHRFQYSRPGSNTAKVAAFLLTLVTGLPVALAGEDRTYDPVGHEAIAAIHQILIDNGKCENRNDCNKKQYVFFASSSSGLTFTVYGVTEKEIVAPLVGALSAQAQKLPSGAKLVAQFFRITKEADLRRGLFSSAPVFAEISVAGSYDSKR